MSDDLETVTAAIHELADRQAAREVLALTFGGELAITEHDGDYQFRIDDGAGGHFAKRMSWLDVLGAYQQLAGVALIAPPLRAELEHLETQLAEAIDLLREIAGSDPVDNALDPDRNRRIALQYFAPRFERDDPTGDEESER